MNVLIVGAGPTGLTAALELARRGVIPEIVDAKDAPSTLSRAVGILPKSIETLNRTGVGDKLAESGVQITRVNLYRDGKCLVDVDITNHTDPTDFITGLPQDKTETIISETLTSMGVDVQYGRQVVNVETKGSSATATFADGRTATYDWVIGADGVASTTRESLGIHYEGYELAETWSIADLDLSPEDYDTHKINAWMLDGDRDQRDVLVMFPMGSGRVRLVSSTPDSVSALPLDLDIEAVRHTGTFRISVRHAESYVTGRVLLAGDAAHAHSPVGGRGMNLGIDDGQAVASAVIEEDTETYAQVRQAKASHVINGTERARKIILSNNPIVGAGLKLAGWLITNVTFFQRQFVENVTRL